MKNEQPDVVNDPRTQLAVERTMLAWERTQLAWIRTVMGFITAGVALDKGFALLHEARLLSGDAWVKNGHLAGLVLTISGTLLIITATINYVKRIRQLVYMPGEKIKQFDPALILSFLITLTGVLVVYFLFTA